MTPPDLADKSVLSRIYSSNPSSPHAAAATPNLNLNAAPIAAYLLWFGVDAVGSVVSLRFPSAGERVLILRGAVANPLLRTLAICWAEAWVNGANRLLPVFVLTRRSTRLPRVNE